MGFADRFESGELRDVRYNARGIYSRVIDVLESRGHKVINKK